MAPSALKNRPAEKANPPWGMYTLLGGIAILLAILVFGRPAQKGTPQWFTPALVGTVAFSFLAELRGVRTEMKADINGLRGEVKEDFKSFRAEVDEDFKSFRVEVNEDFRSFRAEVNEDFKGFRVEVKEDLKGFRVESKDDVRVSHADLSTRIDKQEVAVNQMRIELKGEIQELRKWSQQGYAEIKADIRQLWPTVKT